MIKEKQNRYKDVPKDPNWEPPWRLRSSGGVKRDLRGMLLTSTPPYTQKHFFRAFRGMNVFYDPDSPRRWRRWRREGAAPGVGYQQVHGFRLVLQTKDKK